MIKKVKDYHMRSNVINLSRVDGHGLSAFAHPTSARARNVCALAIGLE
jgi:hypothetical protein